MNGNHCEWFAAAQAQRALDGVLNDSKILQHLSTVQLHAAWLKLKMTNLKNAAAEKPFLIYTLYVGR